MKLQHYALYDVEELIDIIDVDNFQQFIKNVAKFGQQQNPDVYDPLTYMGDVFELFAEYFFKFFNGDPILTYITDYEPNIGKDVGTDGFGKSTIDGSLALVQIKYKVDPTQMLTNADDISNIAADAIFNEEIKFNGKNIIVFTSGAGVHPKHAMHKCPCISFRQIQRRVDNNSEFWSTFKSIVRESTVLINA